MQVQQENQRINQNTHVKINLNYLTEVFFGKYYIGIVGDIFNVLMTIVYFRTTHLNNNYQQKLLQNYIIATVFTFGFGLLIRTVFVGNAIKYYGQNLTISEVKKKITFIDNKFFLTFLLIFTLLFQLPRVLIYNYFIPLTKSTMCDLYGPINCYILKAFCVVNLIITFVLFVMYFCGLLFLPTYFTGIEKDIATFFRNNIIGLIFGNIINSFKIN